MQNDIEADVDFLVKEGIVDPNRVCLHGASYGGYAMLMGLAKTPDKYRCGVAALVVSNLILRLNSNKTGFGSNKSALNFGIAWWAIQQSMPNLCGDRRQSIWPPASKHRS